MSIPITRLAFPSLASLFLGAHATAQIITGTVLSSTGVPVPGVNIDGFDTSGNEINLSNDGTNASGNFTTTVDDGPGVYTFVFYPPAPPLTTHLVAQRENVVVVTTTNLGTITLGAGVLLSGRTVQVGGAPVSGVLLTVLDGPTGEPVLQVNEKTNAFGNFNLAVPAHAIEFQLDASNLVLGSKSFDLAPTGGTAMGDILLPPGAMVTAHVQRTNGTPVTSADFDFKRTSNRRTAFTPGDNSNSSGDLSVVVAIGKYDIEVCPEPGDALPAKGLLGVQIQTTTDLGTITIPNGVKLFGAVLDWQGQPAVKADVDAFSSATGAEVPLCHDDSDATGAYSVFVPAGTYDIVFSPRGRSSPNERDLHMNVVVNTQTQLNGQLPHPFPGRPASGLPGGASIPLSAGPSGGSGGPPPVAPAFLLVGRSPAELVPGRHVGFGRVLPLAAFDQGLLRPHGAGGHQRIFLRTVLFDERGGSSLGPIQAVQL